MGEPPLKTEDRELTYPPDEGCSYSGRCLDCPLLACRFDNQRVVSMLRADAVREARRTGATVPDLANSFGLGERQVRRIIRGIECQGR